jgi:hypothetical protein
MPSIVKTGSDIALEQIDRRISTVVRGHAVWNVLLTSQRLVRITLLNLSKWQNLVAAHTTPCTQKFNHNRKEPSTCGTASSKS